MTSRDTVTSRLDEQITADAGVYTDRRKARVVAMRVLYEADSVRHDPTEVLERVVGEASLVSSAKMYAQGLVAGVLDNREQIDDVITEFAPSWPINQMATVDRNILRTAIYEIVLCDETPTKVSINEAVELAKAFGSDSSARFVNGVLGSVMQTFQK